MSEPVTEETYLDPTFRLSSPAFAAETTIPPIYTIEGAGTSPPLAWSTVPEGTKSFTLIASDPDAPRGEVTHWVVYDIPGSLTWLDEGAATALPAGALSGKNTRNELGWIPPAPPPGDKAHRYLFKLYAVDKSTLGLPEGATRDQVEDAVTPHTLSIAAIEGLFQRL